MTFTNNPDYIDADTKQGLNRDDKNRPIPTHYGTGADERLVIPVSKIQRFGLYLSLQMEQQT